MELLYNYLILEAEEISKIYASVIKIQRRRMSNKCVSLITGIYHKPLDFSVFLFCFIVFLLNIGLFNCKAVVLMIDDY